MPIDFKSYRDEIAGASQEFCNRWCKREHVESNALNSWKLNIFKIIDGNISFYEGCSNMNASSFITFFTYMLRPELIPFWNELFVAFKMAANIKKHPLYFSSYRPLYTDHSCILKFF